MSLKSLWEALTGRRADEDKPPDHRPPEIRLPTYSPLSVRRDIEGVQSEEVTLLATSENVVSFRSPSLLLPEQKIIIETVARQFEAVVRQVEPDGFNYLVYAEILPRDIERISKSLEASGVYLPREGRESMELTVKKTGLSMPRKRHGPRWLRYTRGRESAR